jgi:hypothetical protein
MGIIKYSKIGLRRTAEFCQFAYQENTTSAAEKYGNRQRVFRSVMLGCKQCCEIILDVDRENVGNIELAGMKQEECDECTEAMVTLSSDTHYTVDGKRVNQRHSEAMGIINELLLEPMINGEYKIESDQAVEERALAKQVLCSAYGIWILLQIVKEGDDDSITELLNRMLDCSESHGGTYILINAESLMSKELYRLMVYNICHESVIIAQGSEPSGLKIQRIKRAWKELRAVYREDYIL